MKNIHSDGGILKGYQASLVVQLVKKRRPWFGSLVGKVPWRIDRLPAHISLDFPGGLDGRTSACNAGDLGQGFPLEEDMATHSSILAWRMPMGRGVWWAIVHGVSKSQA